MLESLFGGRLFTVWKVLKLFVMQSDFAGRTLQHFVFQNFVFQHFVFQHFVLQHFVLQHFVLQRFYLLFDLRHT